MRSQRSQKKRTIPLDLPLSQIQWLDEKAFHLMSRSAFVRHLISKAMESDDANL